MLLGFYGARFVDQWRDVDDKVMQRVWEKELSKLTMGELSTGVEACRTRKFPPTLPEFLMLCRPPVNYEEAYTEAIEQMKLRNSGHDDWSNPAIYFAAARLGDDFRILGYPALKYRWQRSLDAALTDWREGRIEAVPPRPLAIPHNPTATKMPDAVREMAERMKRELAEKEAHERA